VLTYFVLTYVISWTLWFAASAIPASGPHGLLILLGTFAPGLVALGLTGRTAGRAGLGALLHRLIDWNVSVRWYFFAISYIVVIKLIVAVLYRGVAGAWPQFGDTPSYLMLAATLGSTLVGGQAGEEAGWRGYALPGLAQRFGLGWASIILGVLWATWHLPFFFMPDADTFRQSFTLYLLQVTALSVAFAWLCASVRGSLVPVMLLHAAVNNTKDIVPSAEVHATNAWALSHSIVGWLTVTLLWLAAGYFLVRMRRLPALEPATGIVLGDARPSATRAQQHRDSGGH